MTSARKLKNRLKKGENALGTLVTIFDSPEIARIIKNCGFDYFVLDAEHGQPNTERMYSMFGYARLLGIPALLRIADINKTELFRAMDMGVDGIICPNVETAEQARELVSLTKYYPMGRRGVSLTRPHTGYEKVNALEYMKEVNADLFIICQTESRKGIKNLPEILKTKGVDGILIGPNDLSQDMGILNQLDNSGYIMAIKKIADLCKASKKICGISGKNLSDLKQWIDYGIIMNQWGSDVSIFMTAAKEGLKNFIKRKS
jgi:2-dehydro-3-deoxyglucarate aldolase/4-hydroxy-2-oxoheptanedioate aldolase